MSPLHKKRAEILQKIELQKQAATKGGSKKQKKQAEAEGEAVVAAVSE
jgi:hypothetical protein